MDKEETWEKHQNPSYILKVPWNHIKAMPSAKLLEKLGWTDKSITYTINNRTSHRVRSPEHDYKEYDVLALGCSFTFGVGLPYEQCWPGMLEDKTGLRVKNAGRGGAGLTDCVQQLYRCFDEHVPKYVCVLKPPSPRVDIYIPDNFVMHERWLKRLNRVANFTLQSQPNLDFTLRVANDVIQYICDKHNVKVVKICCDNSGFLWDNPIPDLARDLAHSGIHYQDYVAEKFIKLLDL